MADKIFYGVLFLLFGNMVLAIGQGPWEIDVMRVILVIMFAICVVWYNWPKIIPVRVYAVCEIALWVGLLAFGAYYKVVYALMIGAGLAMLVGMGFYCNYLKRKDK